jgi:hypothetical protein
VGLCAAVEPRHIVAYYVHIRQTKRHQSPTPITDDGIDISTPIYNASCSY